MSEGDDRKRQAAEAARRQRSDWFGRSLGDDWVEVEPGIFQHRPGAAKVDVADAPLDEELLGALPKRDEEVEAEPDFVPPDPSPRRGWFRR